MPELPQVSLAARVRELRLAAGLTQQDLAGRADLALRTVARIEGGEQATVATLQAIARVLDVTLVDLLADRAAS